MDEESFIPLTQNNTKRKNSTTEVPNDKPTETNAQKDSDSENEQVDKKPETQSWYERIKTAAISSTTGIANATAKIKYAFISKDTEEAFLQVWDLMNLLLKDVPFNKLDLLFGLMMLQEYYKAIPVRSKQVVRDPDLIYNARHYMKFAGASFGPKYIHGMVLRSAGGVLQGIVGGDQANIDSLCSYCGVHPEDVILSKWTSTSYDPGHYLVIDHARGALVLAIRGTFHLKDCLTDLVAHSATFEDGWVHKGFYKAAKRKLELLEPTILEYLHRHPLYEFVVCGHSMGAGIGAIFTLLFHKAHPDVLIRCYAFGCPCILSPELAMAPLTNKLITTFVLGDDVVPQLSIESMNKLKAVVVQILSQSNNSIQRAFHWVASNNALSDSTLSKIASILQCTPKPEMLERPQTVGVMPDSLYPPGNIYHIFKRVETTTTTTTTTTSHSSSSSSLSDSSSSVTTTVITPPTPSPSLSLSQSSDLSSSSSLPDSVSTITETVKEVTVKVKSPPLPPPPALPPSDIPSTKEDRFSLFPPSPSLSSAPPISPSKPPSIFLTPTKAPSSSSTSATPTQSPQISPRGESSQTTITTTQEAKELGYDLEKSNPSLFHEIFISQSMFLDHMPHMYEHAFKVMVEEHEEQTKQLIVWGNNE